MFSITSRLKFNRIFKPVNETHCRYRVVLGSAGSGKSVNVAQDFILKLSDTNILVQIYLLFVSQKALTAIVHLLNFRLSFFVCVANTGKILDNQQ